MFNRLIATTFISFILCVESVSAYEFVATITKIQDGDTLSATVNNEDTKIRLLDVDCFETKNNTRARLQQMLERNCWKTNNEKDKLDMVLWNTSQIMR